MGYRRRRTNPGDRPLSTIRIDLLADHPAHPETLARWHMEEWAGYYAGRTLAQVTGAFQARARRSGLPQALLALKGTDVVGTVSLAATSISTHAHLTPWMIGLYVAPEQRGKGVASVLVRHAVDRARSLGERVLHVAVRSHEESYVSAGWEVIDRVRHEGEDLVVLRLTLSPR